jgi:hypothetical protein
VESNEILNTEPIVVPEIKKVKFKSKFYLLGHPLKVDIDTRLNVEVYIDEVCEDVVPEGIIRIILLQEPYRGDLMNYVHANRDTYTYVLTYQDALLTQNPKAIQFLGTTSWMQGHDVTDKHFGVSTVVGGKSEGLEGYSLRHKVWNNRNYINIPKEFYLSSRFKLDGADYVNELVLGNSKVPLFNCMFHIAIENMSINNMFTEKILDCFQSKVVPIYWGCPNIGEYFNTNGIIAVKNINELVDVCNRLTPDVYQWMLPFIEENNHRAPKWFDYGGLVKEAIIKLLNEDLYNKR